jgi:hypothetical protein
VYLFGMRRIVYPYVEESLEADTEYVQADSAN